MGTDINGWVEVRRIYERIKLPFDAEWRGAIKVGSLIFGGTDMFSCLFGVTPYAAYVPVAADRGLPNDISEEATTDYLAWEDVFSETWIAWSEIATIDWSEDALDGRPHRYKRDAAGEWVYVGKGGLRSSYIIEEGNSWQEDETIYKVERTTRRDAMAPDWELLFELMERLALTYGEDNVRIVAWFDR